MADKLTELEGRIAALELFNRMVLTALATSKPSDPVAKLDRLQTEMMGSLRMLEGAVVDDADAAIWSEMVDALNLAFSSARSRLVDVYGEAEQTSPLWPAGRPHSPS